MIALTNALEGFSWKECIALPSRELTNICSICLVSVEAGHSLYGEELSIGPHDHSNPIMSHFLQNLLCVFKLFLRSSTIDKVSELYFYVSRTRSSFTILVGDLSDNLQLFADYRTLLRGFCLNLFLMSCAILSAQTELLRSVMGMLTVLLLLIDRSSAQKTVLLLTLSWLTTYVSLTPAYFKAAIMSRKNVWLMLNYDVSVFTYLLVIKKHTYERAS